MYLSTKKYLLITLLLTAVIGWLYINHWASTTYVQ